MCIHRCVYTAASGLLGDSRSGRDLVGRQGNVQFQYFKIKILHLFSAWVLQNRWSLFLFSNVNFVCNQLMAQELPESQDLHAELVHQPAQFYHQVSMRQGGKVAGRPRIHLLNCRGSTSPRSAPTQLCRCVCVVHGGEGDGMSGQKGSLQDPSAPPSRLQGRNKEPRYEVLEDNGLQPGKDLPNSPRQD